MTNSDAVQIVRFIAWTLEFGCCLVAIHYIIAVVKHGYRLGDEVRTRVAIGIAVKCGGWAAHQFYWWLWQVAVSLESQSVKTALEASSSITILAYLAIFAGEILVISPWLQRVAGDRWPWAGAGIVLSLGAIGAVIARAA